MRVALALLCAAPMTALAGEPIRVKPACALTESGFRVFVAVDAAYTKNGKPDEPDRALFDVLCSLEDASCSGLYFRIGDVERTGTMDFMDITTMQGAHITSQTGNVFTVKWGIRTLVVDFATRRVAYIESGDSVFSDIRVEGRGTANCD